MSDVTPDAVNPDEVLGPGETEGDSAESTETDFVSQPAKVMRIGSMVKTLLDEARTAPLDEAGRLRLREIYETSVRELSDADQDQVRQLVAVATGSTVQQSRVNEVEARKRALAEETAKANARGFGGGRRES